MLCEADYKKFLGFDDLKLRLIGIPLVGTALPPVFSSEFWQIGQSDKVVAILISIGFTALYWQVGRAIVVYFRKRYQTVDQSVKRLNLQYASLIAFTVIFSILCTSLLDVLDQSCSCIKVNDLWEITTASLCAMLIVAGIYETKFFMTRWKESLVESERLKKESMHSQLEALKNQVNPHFLFNSLNALTSIIPEEPEVAVEFVQKLSKVYRYILEIKDKEVISLNEEMRSIHAYIFLLKTRFHENFQIEINIPEEQMDKHIVPLSIQMLLENAIKHNIVSSKKPLMVEVHVEGDMLIVTNNFQPKEMPESSTKTGLDNIRTRYKILTEKDIEVFEDNQYFRVSIPLVDIKTI